MHRLLVSPFFLALVLNLLLSTGSISRAEDEKSRPVILPRSADAAIESTLSELIQPSTDRVGKVNLLSNLSLDPEVRKRFIETLQTSATYSQLRELEWEIEHLKKNLRPSPSSHGFAGGFRALAWAAICVNAHWFMQGHWNSFINDPVYAIEWQQSARNLELSLLLVGLGYTYNDLRVWKSEKPAQRDWKKIRNNSLEFLDDLEKAVKTAKTYQMPAARIDPSALEVLEQIPERPLDLAEASELLDRIHGQTNNDPKEQSTTQGSKPLERLLEALRLEEKGLKAIEDWGKSDPNGFLRSVNTFVQSIDQQRKSFNAAKKLLNDYLRSATPTETQELLSAIGESKIASAIRAPKNLSELANNHRELSALFSKWLATNPGFSKQALLKETYLMQRDLEENGFRYNAMNKWGQRMLAALGITVGLFGAYTNTTDKINPSDFIVPGTELNLTQKFRDMMQSTWIRYAIPTVITTLWSLQFKDHLKLMANRKTYVENYPRVPEAEWRLIRQAILSADPANTEPDDKMVETSVRNLIFRVAKQKGRRTDPIGKTSASVETSSLAECLRGMRKVALGG